jgi:hypothetical protein
MVRIESNPFEIGSFTIKSRAIVWNGKASWTGVMGDSGAFSCLGVDLVPLTFGASFDILLDMPFAILGHQ